MDRIQKALEKAKQRHAQKPEPIRVEPTKAENSVSQAEDPLAAPIESISYSQTT